MLPFFPDVKMIPAYFFFSFHGYSERISCDPNPDSWSLNRRNEIVCIAHLLLYKILWFIYSFPSFFGPDPDPQINADSDPDRAKTCGSGSETLMITMLLNYPLFEFGYHSFLLRPEVSKGEMPLTSDRAPCLGQSPPQLEQSLSVAAVCALFCATLSLSIAQTFSIGHTSAIFGVWVL